LVFQDPGGLLNHKVIGDPVSIAFGDHIARSGKTRHARMGVVGIACDDIHPAFLQHPLGQRLRPAAKRSQQRARRDLHETPRSIDAVNNVITRTCPAQTFGMRQYRDITSGNEAANELLEIGGNDLVRRLEKEIARAVQRRNNACLELFDKIGGDVNVRAHNEAEFDLLFRQRMAKSGDAFPDSARIIVIEAGQYMRGARHDPHSVLNGDSGHGYRCLEIFRPVVTPRKKVGMKIYHTARTNTLQIVLNLPPLRLHSLEAEDLRIYSEAGDKLTTSDRTHLDRFSLSRKQSISLFYASRGEKPLRTFQPLKAEFRFVGIQPSIRSQYTTERGPRYEHQGLAGAPSPVVTAMIAAAAPIPPAMPITVGWFTGAPPAAAFPAELTPGAVFVTATHKD